MAPQARWWTGVRAGENRPIRGLCASLCAERVCSAQRKLFPTTTMALETLKTHYLVKIRHWLVLGQFVPSDWSMGES